MFLQIFILIIIINISIIIIIIYLYSPKTNNIINTNYNKLYGITKFNKLQNNYLSFGYINYNYFNSNTVLTNINKIQNDFTCIERLTLPILDNKNELYNTILTHNFDTHTLYYIPRFKNVRNIEIIGCLINNNIGLVIKDIEFIKISNNSNLGPIIFDCMINNIPIKICSFIGTYNQNYRAQININILQKLNNKLKQYKSIIFGNFMLNGEEVQTILPDWKLENVTSNCTVTENNKQYNIIHIALNKLNFIKQPDYQYNIYNSLMLNINNCLIDIHTSNKKNINYKNLNSVVLTKEVI